MGNVESTYAFIMDRFLLIIFFCYPVWQRQVPAVRRQYPLSGDFSNEERRQSKIVPQFCYPLGSGGEIMAPAFNFKPSIPQTGVPDFRGVEVNMACYPVKKTAVTAGQGVRAGSFEPPCNGEVLIESMVGDAENKNPSRFQDPAGLFQDRFDPGYMLKY